MDIAQLGISVDSRQVKGATADLSGMTAAAGRAEKATDALAGASGRFVDAAGRLREANGQFVKGADRATSATQSLTGGIGGATSATQAFGSALASLGIAAATTQLVKMADTYGLLQSKIGLATGSMENAAAATDLVFQAAQRSRAGLDALGSMVAKLAPSIKDMGGTTKDAVAASELFAKTLKISGATAEESASAILQFGQALAAGRLGGEEFNAVNESGGRYMQLLAKEMGVTRGELKKLAENGELTSDVLINALANGSKTVEQEFQNLRLTSAETFELMKNSTMQAAFEIDKASGVSQTFNGIMNAGRGIIDAVTLALRDTNSTASDTSIIIPTVTKVFQTLGVIAAETIYVFKETGNTLGALAAQAAALAQGDLDLWRRIGEERDRDSIAARAAVDKMTASILSSETASKALAGSQLTLSTGLQATASSAEKVNTFLTEQQKKEQKVADLRKKFAEEDAKLRKDGLLTAELEASRKTALNEQVTAIMGKATAASRAADKAAREALKAHKEAAREAEKAFKEAAKASEDFGNAVKRARDSALESAIRQADAVEELVERAKEEAKTYGMSAEELAKYNLEQAETAVKTARTAGIAKERIEQLEREVKARRELVGLTSSAARRDEAAEAKKATEQAAADMGKSVQGTLATAIKAGFESGNPVKGFAKSLYQQTKTAIINAIADGMATRLAAGIMGGTASGAASANGMSGMMQSANSMYQMYQQGVGGYVSGLGQSFSTSSLGQFFGLSDASGALTQAGADFTVSAGNFADSVNTFGGYATAAYDVFNSFKTGDGWGKAAGSTIGAVFGGAAGAMIGRTVGGFVDDAFGGGGGAKTGGFASTGAMDRLYTPSQADASLAKVVGGVTDSIGALAKSLGVAAGGFNVGLGFDTDPQGSAGNRVSSRLLDSAGKVIYESINRQVEDAQAGVAVEAQRLALAAIKSSNLPEEFARAFGSVAIAEATDEQVASITAQLQAIKAVKDVFDTVGAAMSQLKGLGYEARESLVALAGGVENLTAGLASYYQNFYTDAERSAAATEQLRKQFSDMGMTLPATREAFRALVEAQDLTTEAGRRMYAQLIGLSGAVAEFATRTEEAARKAAEAAAAKAEADRRAFEETVRVAEEARRAYDDLVRDAQRTYESSVRDAFSALSAAVNAEKDAVNKSAQAVIDDYQRQISAQEKLAESARKSASSLQSVTDILSAGVRSIRGGMTVAAARSFISSSIAAGGVTDTEQLRLAVDTIKAIDESQYSTREELDRVRGQAAGDMDVLQKITGKQLTEAMRQVTAAESAASSLKLMIEETVKGRDQQLAALDAMLQQQQAQVNAALGIKDAVMSVEAAIAALGGAIRSTPVLPPAPPPVPTAPTVPVAPVVTTPPVVTPPPVHTGAGAAPSGSKSVYSAINDIYQQVLKREADASGLIFYATQAMGGKSLDQIRAEIANSPEAKRIDGSHRNGLDRVPFDGYRAELHAGERVLTAQQADSSDKMVEDVSSMDGTMKRVYQVLDRVEQLFNDWNEGGLPPTRA